MGEGAIGLGHLMRVFLFLHDAASIVVGVNDLGCERVLHRHTLATVRSSDDPAKGERFLTFKRNLDRDLIGSTTDSTALDLKSGTGVFQRAE